MRVHRTSVTVVNSVLFYFCIDLDLLLFHILFFIHLLSLIVSYKQHGFSHHKHENGAYDYESIG